MRHGLAVVAAKPRVTPTRGRACYGSARHQRRRARWGRRTHVAARRRKSRGHYPARAGPPCRHPAPGKCIARPPRVGPEVFSPMQDEITRPSVSRGGYRHCLCDSGGVGRPMRQHRHELRVPRPRRIPFGRYEWASRSRCRPKILTRSATGWLRRSLRLRSTTS
jgi:hypothetical protein